MVFSLAWIVVSLLTSLCFPVVVADERGGFCRIQFVESLLVDNKSFNNTHYSAIISISISFATNAPSRDLDLPSTLQLWSLPPDSTDQELLPFEHFSPTLDNVRFGETSMIVKTQVPLNSSSINVMFEKDGVSQCGSQSVLLDKGRCIDVSRARLVRTSQEEFSLSVTLVSTESRIARTNARLPPTDDISWQISTDDTLLKDFSLVPEEESSEASTVLYYNGTLKAPPYAMNDGGVDISAFDHSFSEWRSCGQPYWVFFEDGPSDSGASLLPSDNSAHQISGTTSGVGQTASQYCAYVMMLGVTIGALGA